MKVPDMNVFQLAMYIAKEKLKGASKQYVNAFNLADRNFYVNDPDSRIVKNMPAGSVRKVVRELQKEHPIVDSVLRSISASVIGKGIVPGFNVVDTDGNSLSDINKRLADLWFEWSQNPEVTGTYSDVKAQNSIFRQQLRDGEIFVVHRIVRRERGNRQLRVPYQYQILDANCCIGDGKSFENGIEFNEWGQPTNYRFVINNREVVIKAEDVSHLATRLNVNDTRGTSTFSSCLSHIEDLRIIDTAERQAAKVAAVFLGYIKRGLAEDWTSSGSSPRDVQVQSGRFVTDLQPGEDMGILESKRPHSNLLNFVDEIIRRIAGATGSSFSSISKKYGGTYSAQRQELVEQSVINGEFFEDYLDVFERVKYRKWMDIVIELGLLGEIPTNVNEMSFYKPAYNEIQIPWIDPAKEARYRKTMVDSKLLSRQHIARSMGVDWNENLAELQEESEIELFETEQEDPESAESGFESVDVSE